MAEIPDGAIVSARELARSFMLGGQEVQAVRAVTLDLYPGEFIAIIGRSGSGKTTLLNLLGSLDTPTSGSVYIEGRDISSLPDSEITRLRREKLGFVFQSFGLLPLLSAYENVELPLRIAGMARHERDTRTREAVEIVGLSYRLKHRPYELSGGEQQRLAIARAMVHRPPLILADEPTAELDSNTAKGIFDLLRQLVYTDKITVVVATHDRLITETAHRILEIQDGALQND